MSDDLLPIGTIVKLPYEDMDSPLQEAWAVVVPKDRRPLWDNEQPYALTTVLEPSDRNDGDQHWYLTGKTYPWIDVPEDEIPDWVHARAMRALLDPTYSVTEGEEA
jgi:hypothetical protein